MLLRVRVTVISGLAIGVVVALGARLFRTANTPPPEPIGHPLTSSWRVAGWLGLVVALIIATCAWVTSGRFGFFVGEEDADDEENGTPEAEELRVGSTVRYRSSPRIGTVEEVDGFRVRVRFSDYVAWLDASELTEMRGGQ